ncbi:enhanced intracellular survival protein Eis [Gulosibacter sp. 10]|uniref:GNAT family N-acetyltransferase n=1 Tax=Gulosibacter sp. 10 TaxID=1255570 RepID=UPI00097EF407|nr:GNAT family N-acetyltransferase [Gulosibacter sp. 10]SJM57418.1 UPF0256 protein SAV5428 [Gulosibacter sp. 10]
MEQFEFVHLDEDRRDQYEQLNDWTWPSTFTPEQQRALPFPFDPEHTLGFADGDRLAAEAAFYPFPDLAVPGGRVRANGLSTVAVHPSYRRRGLLRSMIERYFEMSIARGDALSLLTAQEYGIYGRFGYGHASDTLTLRIPHGTRLVAPRDGGGAPPVLDFDYADPDRDAAFIHRVQRAQDRPGTPVRELDGFQRRALIGEPLPAQPVRILRVGAEGAPAAYALYTRPHADASAKTLTVFEWNALDARAEHALWQALVEKDLIETVVAMHVPTDSPLLSLLPDPRVAEPALRDDMFARILDLPACAEARRYGADLDLVLRVDDPVLEANDGRWRLRIAEGRGSAVRAEGEEPDLALSMSQLSAAYLGRPVIAAQARAGLLEERTRGAADALHRALIWPEQPAATWGF